MRGVYLSPAFPRQAQQGHQSTLCPAAADVGLEDIEYPTAEGLGAISLCEEPDCIAATGGEDADCPSLIIRLHGQFDRAGHLLGELICVPRIDSQYGTFILVAQCPGKLARTQPRLAVPIDDRQRGRAEAQLGG